MRATLLVDVTTLRPRLLSLEPDAPLPLTATMPVRTPKVYLRTRPRPKSLTANPT